MSGGCGIRIESWFGKLARRPADSRKEAAMQELLQAAVQVINLPWTILLGFVLLYWLLMIVGLFDFDTIDGHFDFHKDVHLSGDPDAGGHDVPSNGGGWLHSVLHFLNLGDVPLMAVLSVLTLTCWTFSILANHHFNPEYSLLWGGVLLIPNLLICLVLTHFVTLPLRVVFRKLNQDQDAKIEVIGQVAKVTSGEANATFGQATIDHEGVPITLNVRAPAGTVFHRGDRVLVIEEDREKHTYQVVKYEEPS